MVAQPFKSFFRERKVLVTNKLTELACETKEVELVLAGKM